MIVDRFDEDFTEYRCSDCDPDTVIDDEAPEYEKPYVLLVPTGEAVPKFCPRCGSYLSLCDGEKGLRITNHLRERWIAKQQAES